MERRTGGSRSFWRRGSRVDDVTRFPSPKSSSFVFTQPQIYQTMAIGFEFHSMDYLGYFIIQISPTRQASHPIKPSP